MSDSSKSAAIKTALKGDWSEAISMNKALLEENPNDVEALNRIALAFTILGRHDKARSAYQKVLEIDSLNSIALKNLKKFSKDSKKSKLDIGITVNNIFIEETGKTKIVDLINLAQAEVLAVLKTGQTVNLSVKRLKVFVVHGEKQYLGVLPDDIGKRLIKFIKGGNRYEAFVKSVNHQSMTVFIRETKKSVRFKDQPSFHSALEGNVKKIRARRPTPKPEEKYYDEEESSEGEEDEE